MTKRAYCQLSLSGMGKSVLRVTCICDHNNKSKTAGPFYWPRLLFINSLSKVVPKFDATFSPEKSCSARVLRAYFSGEAASRRELPQPSCRVQGEAGHPFSLSTAACGTEK
jgi:hypothetical protein